MQKMAIVELLEKTTETKKRIELKPEEEAVLGSLLEAIKEKGACNEKLLHRTIKILLEKKDEK